MESETRIESRHMKTAYFDCFSGASGDMILGALLDAGLPLEDLRRGLSKLGLSHFEVDAARVTKKGIRGIQALVRIEDHHHHHHHRHLSDIRTIIEQSDLDDTVKEDSIRIFTRLAEAEAKVHDTTIESIHFHEVGAMDAIIDIVGAVIGLQALGIEKVVCSPLHVGTGTVECAHGTLPVPAPATAELIVGKPSYATGVTGELLTPTGAAILATLAAEFGPMPAMRIEAVGYGAGEADRETANLLRLFIGRRDPVEAGPPIEPAAELEAAVDDGNSQE